MIPVTHRIAAAQAEACHLPGARETLLEAIETAGWIEDDFFKAQALGAIAAAQAEAGDIPGAIETAGWIEDDRFKAQALATIAAAEILNTSG